jgi:geranylgeranyl diphosphate synthase type II
MMNDHLKSLLAEIDKAIQGIESGSEPENLYDPIRYILDLGGKRIRPLLTLLAYQLYQDDFRKALRPSLAVEVFHNFTLVHDDIMDKAPLRRNKPSVHKKWNENIAILSGDVMLVRVYDLLLEVEDPIVKNVITRFNNCAVEVCEGQQYDMDFETKEVVTESEYVNMIKLKTAVLLGFSLEMGGLMAGASELDLKYLKEFGINIGIGFQLMDDLLDVYADKDLFGKQVGGDILSNKKTYLLIKALELAHGEEYDALHHWLTVKDYNKKEKVNSVTAIYDRLGIEKLTKGQINKYFKRGLEDFSKIDVREDRKVDLLELATYLMNREK